MHDCTLFVSNKPFKESTVRLCKPVMWVLWCMLFVRVAPIWTCHTAVMFWAQVFASHMERSARCFTTGFQNFRQRTGLNIQWICSIIHWSCSSLNIPNDLSTLCCREERNVLRSWAYCCSSCSCRFCSSSCVLCSCKARVFLINNSSSWRSCRFSTLILFVCSFKHWNAS